MDYRTLNLIFGLVLIFALVVDIGSRILLSKVHLPVWLSLLSWVALTISLLSALYIESLFLRLMTPAFNWQIGLGLLLIGGLGALLTGILYSRVRSSGFAGVLFGVQMPASLAA